VAAATLGVSLLQIPLAIAEPHKLLVLKSEGHADGATRAKVDAAIVKLARVGDPEASAGEMSFSDAATAVGCKPETNACKDEVLGMLAVDEMVITNITPKPGGLEVAVHRVAKGGAARDATTMIANASAADQLDGLAPLFGAASPPPAEISTTPPVGPEEPVGPAPTTATPAALPPSLPPPTSIGNEPAGFGPVADDPGAPRRHRLEMAGFIGGGAMMLLGVVLWAGASSTQSDINNAPTQSATDLKHLRDLESRADGYATWGNLFFVGGAIVGGVATFYYIRDRRRGNTSAQHALLTPAVFDHGGGLALSFGGTP
jgi:hypothetical protein